MFVHSCGFYQYIKLSPFISTLIISKHSHLKAYCICLGHYQESLVYFLQSCDWLRHQNLSIGFHGIIFWLAQLAFAHLQPIGLFLESLPYNRLESPHQNLILIIFSDQVLDRISCRPPDLDIASQGGIKLVSSEK